MDYGIYICIELVIICMGYIYIFIILYIDIFFMVCGVFIYVELVNVFNI